MRIATIGYETATIQDFVRTLKRAGIDLLVDVRAVAASRRPGFAKTRLAAHLEEAGIGYLHLRGLGTPADGRIAARAGDHQTMRRIFRSHLAGFEAQQELHAVADLVAAGRSIALLCLERDPAHCHRSMVADAVAALIPTAIEHLTVDPGA